MIKLFMWFIIINVSTQLMYVQIFAFATIALYYFLMSWAVLLSFLLKRILTGDFLLHVG